MPGAVLDALPERGLEYLCQRPTLICAHLPVPMADAIRMQRWQRDVPNVSVQPSVLRRG